RVVWNTSNRNHLIARLAGAGSCATSRHVYIRGETATCQSTTCCENEHSPAATAAWATGGSTTAHRAHGPRECDYHTLNENPATPTSPAAPAGPTPVTAAFEPRPATASGAIAWPRATRASATATRPRIPTIAGIVTATGSAVRATHVDDSSDRDVALREQCQRT